MRLMDMRFREGATLAPLLLSVFIGGCHGSEKAASPSDLFVGRPAPDFRFKDADGQNTQLSALKGRVVLIDFWTTWCGPCRAEIPAIERLAKHFEKKGVVVLGIDAEEDEGVVRRFVAANKIAYPIVLTKDDPSVARGYAVRALPTAVVIDKDGIVAVYRVGETPTTEVGLYDEINHVLSSRFVAPRPKAVQVAPSPVPAHTLPTASSAGIPDPQWQPKTAEEFLARGYARLRTRKYPEAMADAEDALKLQPDSYMAAFLHGRAAYEEKNYATAIEDFNSVIRERPDWPDGYRYRGLAYANSGQYQKAIPDYQRLIQLKPYFAAGYHDIGGAYRELKQFDLAKVNLDKAIEIEPDYMRARNNRILLFASQNDWANELTEASTMLALAPNDSWARDAKEAAEQKRPLTASEPKQLPGLLPTDVHPNIVSKVEPEYTEEARRAGVNATILCSLVVAKDGVPQDIRVIRGAGFGLDENAVQAVSRWRFQPATRQGEPVAAKAQVELSFRIATPNREGQFAGLRFTLPDGAERPQLVHGQIPENPKDGADGKLRVALTVGTDGKLEDLSIAETTSDKWAESALHEMKGWRFHPATLNGEAVEAKGILEVQRGAFVAGPSSAGPDPTWQPKTAAEFLARGYARLRSRKYPQAEADAEDALKLIPEDAAARFLHGRAAYEDNEYAIAIDDLSKVIEQKPDWPETYRNRGLAYSKSGSAERAAADFQSAIKLDPSLTPAYNDLGHAYTALGQLELAKQSLDKAIELEPDSVLARENRAKLFAKAGDLRAEQNELVLILALSPDHRWAKDEQEALSQKLSAAGRN